jgi:hypothetical protein
MTASAATRIVVSGRDTPGTSAGPPGTWSAADSLRALFAHRLQRLILRSAQTPLRRVWALGYELVARLSAAFFARGIPGASVWLRGGAAGDDLVPGMSDIDLALLAPGDVEPARRRWNALLIRAPWLDRLIDRPFVFDLSEFAAVSSGCALTYGLTDGEAMYFGERPSVDWIRTLEAPGLHGGPEDWRLVRGPDRRLAPVGRDEQDERLAAWLHVLLWWRWAFVFCDQPHTPRSADVCVKLISEPARAWLWLAHRERADGRADALRRLAQRLPEEEPAVRVALDLQRRMTRAPEAPFADVLPALVRMTRRMDELIFEQIADAGADEVRIAAGARHGDALPLADWPAVAAPGRFAETFRVQLGSPSDPAALVSALHGLQDDTYCALRERDLLVLPARPLPRSRLRAVKSRTTDPVSFALLDGGDVARFPRVRGWSASDLAARAVAEHRAWLGTHRMPPRPWSPPPPPCHPLGMALSAGRAALFAESIRAGEPELIAGAEELGRRLGPVGEEAVQAHAASASSGEPPPPAVVAAIETLVGDLPPYD